MNLMSRVFRPYLVKFVVVFADAILIYSRSREEYNQHLLIALQTLRDHQLYGKLSRFLARTSDILGHVMSLEGVPVDPSKIEGHCQLPRLTSVIEVMSSLRLAVYCWQFVQGFSSFATPFKASLGNRVEILKGKGFEDFFKIDRGI